jgi:hypothetical protein
LWQNKIPDADLGWLRILKCFIESGLVKYDVFTAPELRIN